VNPTEPRLDRLANKVRELDSGSRALLDLSVRRGLGDEEIAGVLGTDPSYIAHTRTGVIQSIAADLRLDERERAELEDALAQVPADAWLPQAQPEPEPQGAENGAASPDAPPAAEPEPEAAGAAAPEAEAEPAEAVTKERSTVEPEPAEAAEPHAEAATPEPGEPATTTAEGNGGRTGAATLVESPRRRRRMRTLVALLAVALLAAAVVIVPAWTDDDDGDRADDPPAPVERETPRATNEDATRGRGTQEPERERGARSRGQRLRPLPGHRRARGTARLQGRRLVLRVSGLPRPARRYQVWLYDSLIEAKPRGRLRAAGRRSFRGRFRVRNIGRYRYVDVSIEPRNGNRNHSGRSVLRVRTSKLR
jgi:hypothetical protein